MSFTDQFIDFQDRLSFVIRTYHSHPYRLCLVCHHLSISLGYHPINKIGNGEECFQILPRTVNECIEILTYAGKYSRRKSPHIHGYRYILFQLNPFIQLIQIHRVSADAFYSRTVSNGQQDSIIIHLTNSSVSPTTLRYDIT